MKTADVIKQPIISEKVLRTSSPQGGGWYAFIVSRLADKNGVKMAVETAFSVKVDKIRLLTRKGKRVRDINKKKYLVKNKKPDLKKAYVKLKPGFSINLLSEDNEDVKDKAKSKKKKSMVKSIQNEGKVKVEEKIIKTIKPKKKK
jgi:large subunit ribosomal protein L23